MRLPRVRVRVRSLMILVLVVGCGLGWIVHRARVQREAVAAIKKAEGTLLYDWQFADGDLIKGQFADGDLIKDCQPPGPQWLRDRVGPEFLDDVTYVWLDGARATDALMSHVGQFRKLDSLSIWGNTMTVFGRDRAGTLVSDAGMVHLAGLTRLRLLDLSRTRIGDAGLEHLTALTRVKSLGLSGTSVGDAGLKHLAGMTRLELLDLRHTSVSDAGLAHLNGLTRLEMLILDDTRVNDAGLAHLKRLRRLKRLTLGGTRVTEAGIKALQAALPGVGIDGPRGRWYPKASDALAAGGGK